MYQYVYSHCWCGVHACMKAELPVTACQLQGISRPSSHCPLRSSSFVGQTGTDDVRRVGCSLHETLASTTGREAVHQSVAWTLDTAQHGHSWAGPLGWHYRRCSILRLCPHGRAVGKHTDMSLFFVLYKLNGDICFKRFVLHMLHKKETNVPHYCLMDSLYVNIHKYHFIYYCVKLKVQICPQWCFLKAREESKSLLVKKPIFSPC